jgi:hypothetical protein
MTNQAFYTRKTGHHGNAEQKLESSIKWLIDLSDHCHLNQLAI